MVDLIFMMLALGFVILATLAAVATTTSPSRTIRDIASKTVNGSLTAALVSVALTTFFFWPPV